MSRGIGHAIYVFDDKEGHFSIGHSQYSELRSRTNPFLTYDALMESYVVAANDLGYDAWHEIAIHNIDELGLDWRNNAEDIVRMERFFRTGSTD